RGIEVEGFVHDAVEFGDAIVRFDFENFGKFVACVEELGNIGGFEVKNLRALCVEQNGFGSSVYAGKSVFEIFSGVGSAESMGEIARREKLQAGTVKVDAIEMRVIGIFAALAAVRTEVECAGFFVERNDLIRHEFAGRDLIFEFAS